MTTQLAGLLQDALGSDYRLERELEAGGMSRLFIATDARLNRQVVVKVLAPELVSQTSIARFRREIELTVRLQHPYILPILTSGEWEDGLYYITPFIPGESLRVRLARDGALPLGDIFEILRDLSNALAFAHQHGVVHRDIKPGNVLLADGHAILADFGIARAVSSTTTPLTDSGIAPGTPAYMAPELPNDERADVYALGVVAYEMFVGSVPRGRNVTVKELVSARERLSTDRRASVHALAKLIASALSSSPERRPPSARAFAADVDAAAAARLVGRRSAITLSVAAMTLAVVWAWNAAAHVPALSADRYAIVSLDSQDSVSAARSLLDALLEWRGITALMPSIQAGNSAERVEGELGRARNAARRVGARNLVLVEQRAAGDSVIVQATLYDASGDSTVRVRRAAFLGAERGSIQQKMAWRTLANGLVRNREELPWTRIEDNTVPLLSAWRAYDSGRNALEHWNLSVAESAFQNSVELQPSHALARLWLAQTIAWLDRRSRANEIRSSLRTMVELSSPLEGRDSVHAAALLDLATGSFVSACAHFREMRQTDSGSLAAWLGLGDCQAMDQVVVPSPTSPTGWRFQSSYEDAARAYARALDLGPAGANAFQGWVLGRLSTVLSGNVNRLRLGYAVARDSLALVAFPVLDHDTIAYYPFPTVELNSGKYTLPPTSIQAAVNRNRAVMRRVAEDWVRRFPRSAAAYDSLSTWAELAGGLTTIAGRRATTLEVVRQAMSLSGDSSQRLRLGIKEVRVLVKNGQFAEARAAADRLLRALSEDRAPSVDGAAGLAALTGHVEQMAHLLARDSSTGRVAIEGRPPIPLPEQAVELTARLSAFSALGIAGDTTIALARRTSETLDSYFPQKHIADELRGVILGDALTLVFPAGSRLLLALPEPRYAGYRVFRTVARGDKAKARAELTELERRTAGQTPGTAIDMNYRRAVVALLVGDSGSAVRELDPVLRALPTLSPMLLSQSTQAATLVRSFALRAELAAAAGDDATAAQNARAVVELWAGADGPLQPLVERMRVLAK